MNSKEKLYDVVVVGGGINGVGIAADAAGRGLSVLLCEQDDLASATSSASSKLIHGGIRYLEHYHFGLVRESLKERKILSQTAPHLVHPLRFVVPFNKQVRPFWLVRLGLCLYDLLGVSLSFKRSKAIQFTASNLGNPIKSAINSGFIYSDCITDDARLVIENAKRVRQKGGTVLTNTQCISAKRSENHWEVALFNLLNHQQQHIKSKALVNATGPWCDSFIKDKLNLNSQYQLRLVKGSHIVLPKLYDREEAYVLQNKDGRIIFVIPYLRDFTLIGTTDIEFSGDPHLVKISTQEIQYLCDCVNDYFKHAISPKQVLSSWSGVRALVEDNTGKLSAINREYKLELNLDAQHQLPLINVFGGKLTTYRMLAEKAVNKLAPFFSHVSPPWTATTPLPGGNIKEKDLAHFMGSLSHTYPWLPLSLMERYALNYGSQTYDILKNTDPLTKLGLHFGHELYESEVNYLIEHEWAKTAEDILWRRTKLGLVFSEEETKNLTAWLAVRHNPTPIKN